LKEADGLDRGKMMSVLLPVLQSQELISISKHGNASDPGSVQHGIDENDPPPPLHLATASEQIGPAPQQVCVRRQSRVASEPLNDVPSYPFISHEGVAEADDEVWFHAFTSRRAAEAMGIRIVKVLPLPTLLSTEMVPRCDVTIP